MIHIWAIHLRAGVHDPLGPFNSDYSINSVKCGQWPRWLGAHLLYSAVTPRWVLALGEAQSRQSTTGGSTPSKLSPCDHNLIKTLLSTVLILVQNFNWSCHQLGLHVGVHPMVLLSTHSAWPCLVGTKFGEKLKAGGEAGLGKRHVGLIPDSLCCHPSCHPAHVLPHLPPTVGCQLHSLTSLKPINQFLRTPFAFHATGHGLPGGA